MVGACFDDGQLMLLAEAEQRFGHTDVVVEIAQREEHVELLCQNGRGEFLRGGFPVGAGDLQNGCFERAAVVVGQLLEGHQCIVHHNHAGKVLERRVVHYGIGAAGVERFLCEIVSIESRAAKGKEQGTFRAVARVGRHHRVFLKNLVEFGNRHCFLIACQGVGLVRIFEHR